MKGIANIMLPEISFFMNSGVVVFCCFLEALGPVVLVFAAMKTGMGIGGYS